MTWDVTMVMNRRGGLLVFFEPLCKGSCRLSQVFFFTPIFTTFVSVDDPTLLVIGSLSFGAIRRPLMVWPPLKCTCTAYFLQVFLILSLSPCWYGTTMCKFLLLGMFWPVWLLLFLFVYLVGFWLFSLALLMAHVGYLHFLRAWHRWSSSFCNSCGSEHIVLALWYRVPATLYLEEMVWWLSHCKYRSVWVGFLNTDVLRLPSSTSAGDAM